ncbi:MULTISPECIES: hypothetical protein [unclassified Lentimicrobium]|uniref:hypothetical protein n=1 Tax=unclassified Lentimicrobium TaxID=2677434 RepID=UPI00155218F0|nr:MULTISPECIES: hypothetical protein [unclassified Lentimicrobium]NPD44081.1 hypothetical protein [Lentimicrobium sp. S6]NPD86736.1 hypothetical protein [Lentimicrobium sp. L6]
MNKQRKQNGFNLVIAFAILWVSFASIIQFHVERMHGDHVFESLAFIKTENKTFSKKDTTIGLKIDFHSNVFASETSINKNIHTAYTLLTSLNVSTPAKQVYIDTRCLRGPPAIL